MPFDGLWAKGKTPLVNTDPIIKGVKLFKQMYDVGFPQGTDDATASRMYGTGKIAEMLIVSAGAGPLVRSCRMSVPIRSRVFPEKSMKS